MVQESQKTEKLLFKHEQKEEYLAGSKLKNKYKHSATRSICSNKDSKPSDVLTYSRT
jgi:hypothetical protein